MEKYVNRSYCRPIDGNVAMLAYSDSVYYYGQYTEAGSGSFLGATSRHKQMEHKVYVIQSDL